MKQQTNIRSKVDNQIRNRFGYCKTWGYITFVTPMDGHLKSSNIFPIQKGKSPPGHPHIDLEKVIT
jgi:hypothetical protein